MDACATRLLTLNFLRATGQHIDESPNGAHHHVIEATHPSPLAAHGPAGDTFLRSQIFAKINQLLARLRKPSINWQP